MVNAATVIPISLRFPPLLLDPLPASTFAADDTTNAVSFHSLAVGLSTLARFASGTHPSAFCIHHIFAHYVREPQKPQLCHRSNKDRRNAHAQ
jgi:hypothetical protein